MRNGGVLVVLVGMLLLPGLDQQRAFENTDARYLTIARGMADGGDWWVPRFAGTPHLDKPPLTYWAAAAGFKALGPTPFAGRLGVEIAAFLTALLLAYAARRWVGALGATVAALIFLSTALLYVTSRGLQTDVFQLLLFTAAMLAFLRGALEPGRSGWTVAAFAVLGFSMNVKGPIAFALALSIWVPFLLLVRPRARVAPATLGLGLLLFLAFGLPWYAGLALHDPDALRYWLEVQLAGRVSGATPEVGHLHGPLYLVGFFPLALLPWTPLAALALWRSRPRDGWRRADPLDLFLLLWSLVPLLFFSLPRSKSAQYLLPAVPGIALAIGRALALGRLEDRLARRTLGGCAAATAILASGLAIALAFPSLLTTDKVESALLGSPVLPVAALALLATGLGAAALGRLDRLRSGQAIVATATATALVFAVGFHALAPALQSWKEEGEIARSVPGAELVEYGLHRPSLLFYFADHSRFTSLHGPKRHAPAPEDRARVMEMLQRDVPTFVLARERVGRELSETTGAVAVSRRNECVLLANASARRALAGSGTRLSQQAD